MLRCIQLAKNGLGTTYPNPLVGSVIVFNNTIIGEGWHLEAGMPHAEVQAINSVYDTTQLAKATIYVNLEPCSHFGKTPPCANLIIEKGIKNVVIGSTDPNPKVAGKGIIKLIKAGCKVTVGVLGEKCIALNKRFFTFQNKKRPYIVLKWAETKDRFIAPITREEQKPVWISNSFSRQRAHQMRAQEEAILIGTNTVVEDNPSLTTRNYYGSNPTRVIIDRTLKIKTNATVFNGAVKTIIITETEGKSIKNVTYETIDFNQPIANQICNVLYRHNIQSLIVEGGTKTIQTFIDENLWDEAYIFKGPITFNTGVKAPVVDGIQISEQNIKRDILTVLKNKNQ